MADKKTILVLGSSFGGLHAAASARRYNLDARICLIDEGNSRRARLREIAFCERHSIERLNGRVVAIDADANCVHVRTDLALERIGYDALIYLGDNAFDEPHSLGLFNIPVTSIADIATIFADQGQGGHKRVVISGCTARGINAAVKLARAGAKVAVVDTRIRMLPDFSLPFAYAMKSRLKDEGIAVILGEQIVEGVHGGGDNYVLTTSKGRKLFSNYLVNANDAIPQTTLLNNAGAALDIDGMIRVDDSLATTLPHVFACGSAIKVPFVITNERRICPLPDIFTTTARIAGRNAASSTPQEKLSVFCNTVVINCVGRYFARTGLTDEEARMFFGDEGTAAITVHGANNDFAIRLLFDTKRRAVIGAEIHDTRHVHGRISLLSHAVREGFTPEHILDFEMPFTKDDDQLMLDPLKEAALRAQFHFSHEAPIVSAETLALWFTSKRDFVLVDVSDTPQPLQDFTKNIKHVPMTRLKQGLSELSNNATPIVLVAQTSEQSQLAHRSLLHLGYKNIFSLDGGMPLLSLICAREDA